MAIRDAQIDFEALAGASTSPTNARNAQQVLEILATITPAAPISVIPPGLKEGGGGRRPPGPRYCVSPYEQALQVVDMSVVERHHDYLIRVSSVPPGGITNVALPLDSDAPFALRLVRSRNIGLNGFRFRTPTDRWQSNTLRTDWIVPTDPTQLPFPSRGAVIYPQMIFPVDGQIVVDIGNATGSNITNAELLFRGSKLFRAGSILAPTYPAKISPLTYWRQVLVRNVGLGSAGVVRNNQLRINNDADFAFRNGYADSFSLGLDGGLFDGRQFASNIPQANLQNNFSSVYVQLKDESGKAYSNQPININDLFGQGLPVVSGGGANDGPVSFFGGLITPEIYIPRDHSLYFDVLRLDAAGAPALDFYFRFGGAKVFQA